MQYLPKPHSCHLQWHVTEKCNFHCTHCYLNEEYIKQELSTEESFKVVDDFVDFCKKTDIRQNRNITLTGGEPILKKDWWKILEYISKYKKKGLIDRFYVMTNGSTVNEKIIQRYKELGVNYMQISVEGMDKINDEIRGKGNFKKAINGAKAIIQNGIPLSFSLTLTKKNLKDIEPLARLAASIGVSGMGVGRIVPIGMGSQMKDLILTPEETKEWYLEAERINQRLRNERINFVVDYHCSDGLYETIRPGVRNPQTNHGCSTPYDVFTLLPNGDIVPCRRLPIVVGNIREKSFLEIHYSSNKVWNLKNWDNRADECKTCPDLKGCKGGGMCIAYGYFGTPYAPDPDCWKLFDKDLSDKKFEKEPDSDKITYFKRYINNLRFDLIEVPKEELNKKIRSIKIDKIDKINKVKENEIEIIVFDLEEKDLKPETGEKINNFLSKLKKKNISFQIGHTFPPCIFESPGNFKFETPKSCYECPSLFHLENKKRIVFCNGRKGPDLKFMNNKEQIHEYMELLKDYDKPEYFNKCQNCKHRLRGTCFYIKNCRLKPEKINSDLKLVEATITGC
ncbi:radical SAM protein [Bacteroidota bacterium]